MKKFHNSKLSSALKVIMIVLWFILMLCCFSVIFIGLFFDVPRSAKADDYTPTPTGFTFSVQPKGYVASLYDESDNPWNYYSLSGTGVQTNEVNIILSPVFTYNSDTNLIVLNNFLSIPLWVNDCAYSVNGGQLNYADDRYGEGITFSPGDYVDIEFYCSIDFGYSGGNYTKTGAILNMSINSTSFSELSGLGLPFAPTDYIDLASKVNTYDAYLGGTTSNVLHYQYDNYTFFDDVSVPEVISYSFMSISFLSEIDYGNEFYNFNSFDIFNRGYYYGELYSDNIESYDEAFNRGFDEGYRQGYSKGSTVSSDALQSEYERGYNNGKSDGYDEGEEVGYTNGYQTASDEVYDVAYNAGRQAGYQQGFNDGSGDLTFAKFFNNILSIFEVKIFGIVSLADFFIVLFGLSMLFFVLKLFVGG